MKNFSENSNNLHLTQDEVLADMVTRALYASYPEFKHSREALADEARHDFRKKNGDPVDAKTIKYWLAGEHRPSALHLLTLFGMQPKIFMSYLTGFSR